MSLTPSLYSAGEEKSCHRILLLASCRRLGGAQKCFRRQAMDSSGVSFPSLPDSLDPRKKAQFAITCSLPDLKPSMKNPFSNLSSVLPECPLVLHDASWALVRSRCCATSDMHSLSHLAVCAADAYWSPCSDKIYLLNGATLVINFWQDSEVKPTLDEVRERFPDCMFQGSS